VGHAPLVDRRALAEVKARWDQDNLFRLNENIARRVA
jgi:hypothetical protein